MPSSRKKAAPARRGKHTSGGKRNAETKAGGAPAQTGELVLVDLIALAEQAVDSLQCVFSALDESILREFGAIAGSIARTKEDIAHLQPDELSRRHIPEAGRELAAIVEATEDATHRIMEAAERIIEADNLKPAAYRALVDGEVMKIFEACTFQDITGQRVTKVVDTLQDIEERVTRISSAIGAHQSESKPQSGNERGAARKKDELLNGPALAGQGVAQEEVDALFD